MRLTEWFWLIQERLTQRTYPTLWSTRHRTEAVLGTSPTAQGVIMRWPGIVAIAVASAAAGFGAGHYSQPGIVPVLDQFEIRPYGYNNHKTMKVNKRTGESWNLDATSGTWRKVSG